MKNNISEDLNRSPLPQKTTVIQSSNKSKISIILIGTILVTIFIFFGVQIGKHQTSNRQTKDATSTSPIVTQSSITIPTTTLSASTSTTSWKTYTNKYGAYSFQYPDDWYIQDFTDNLDVLDNPGDNNILQSELKNKTNAGRYNNRVSVMVNKVNSQNDLIAALKTLSVWGKNKYQPTNTTLNGASGYKLVSIYTQPHISGTKIDYVNPDSSSSRIDYYLENNGLMYEIELSVNDNTPNKQVIYDEGVQILSSFKFSKETH
jgi:hypothetical protein